jgi:hypothetical protein
MMNKAVNDLKMNLTEKGFTQKAIVSDKEMKEAIKILDSQKGVVSTPDTELRYIEGLFDLPLGYLHEFKVIPAEGSEKCDCGRVPNALDIVYTAHKRQIHDKSLIRDTLIGFSNLIELAESGRAGECFNCGRTIVMAGYWTRKYMYA